MIITCPVCKKDGEAVLKKKVTTVGWILFAVMLIPCFPICWLPFVLDATTEPVRKCAHCGSKLP